MKHRTKRYPNKEKVEAMKKLVITISILVTALLLMFVTQYNKGAKTTEEAMTIAGIQTTDILYEQKTEKGNLILYQDPFSDSLSLAFLERSFSGFELMDSITKHDIASLEEQSGLSYVMLAKSDDVPYTTYAGLTTNPDLFEVLITEIGFPIAHSAKVITSDIEGIYIWLAYSPDFTGSNYSLIGLADDGTVVGDIEHSGTELTIHAIETSEAQ